jgi:hypothetical protein
MAEALVLRCSPEGVEPLREPVADPLDSSHR